MTDIIILAAGIGSRLRPITSTVPKCMVPINNVPLIERLIKQLMFFKDKINIHIVLGYKSEIVINHFKDYKINFIINKDYEITNNMYSFYLASKNIDNISDIIVVNADCIYDDEIVLKIILNDKSCIAVDYNFFNDESMKVEINNGYVRGIAKSYENGSNVFTSIDMYKFLGEDAVKMISHVANIIDSGDKNSWTEVAIDAIVKDETVELEPLSIDNYKWYEIDNHVDLETASKLFFNER